ncbi:uidB [Symbiodinium natans]|uniref:UidB protein n=1 Tax=Symbiodinium natans TaxID=878477 RepID=A0A812Q486_9DINO|nr:uidB [Symbiodinium natans]
MTQPPSSRMGSWTTSKLTEPELPDGLESFNGSDQCATPFRSHAWRRAAPPEGATATPEATDLHVVSLRKPRDSVRACPARSCWTWKERVLGDGHDFFIPRPRTARRLSSVIRSTSSPEVPVEEAAVLGNCKRFDVYLALGAPAAPESVCRHVADVAAQQMACFSLQQGSWLEGMKTWLFQATSGFDFPELVSSHSRLGTVAGSKGVQSDAKALRKVLEVRSGPQAVASYCAAVAAGLEGRPKDAFNPCSARDAHIMLQLKRTLEAVTSTDDAFGGPPCGKRLGLVFRIALEVGKGVRNPQRLPQLDQLQAYGEGRLARAPRAAAAAAAEAAERTILEPAVAKCAGKLRGFRHAGRVRALRAQAAKLFQQLELGSTTAVELQTARRRLNRLLHAPSLALKDGAEIDQEAVLADVQSLVSTTLQTSTSSPTEDKR